MARHGKKICFVQDEQSDAETQSNRLTRAMIVAVRQTYLGLPRLHSCTHDVIVANIAMLLERQQDRVGLWSDDQIAAALDLLADCGQIRLIVNDEQRAAESGKHRELAMSAS